MNRQKQHSELNYDAIRHIPYKLQIIIIHNCYVKEKNKLNTLSFT